MQMLTSPIQESMMREKYYNLIKVKIFINWSVINLAVDIKDTDENDV